MPLIAPDKNTKNKQTKLLLLKLEIKIGKLNFLKMVTYTLRTRSWNSSVKCCWSCYLKKHHFIVRLRLRRLSSLLAARDVMQERLQTSLAARCFYTESSLTESKISDKIIYGVVIFAFVLSTIWKIKSFRSNFQSPIRPILILPTQYQAVFTGKLIFITVIAICALCS